MKPSDPHAAVRAQSARLARLVAALFLCLVALLLLERFGPLLVTVARGGSEGVGLRLLQQAVHAIPEVLYLLGLWWIRQALAALANGDLYAATLTQMIDRVGTALAAGALIGVFIVPSALRLAGSDPGYLIAFDISGLVLGALGLSLKVFAHLFQHAREMQIELQEMF